MAFYVLHLLMFFWFLMYMHITIFVLQYSCVVFCAVILLNCYDYYCHAFYSQYYSANRALSVLYLILKITLENTFCRECMIHCVMLYVQLLTSTISVIIILQLIWLVWFTFKMIIHWWMRLHVTVYTWVCAIIQHKQV